MPDLYLEFLGPPIVRTGSGAAPVPASLQPFLAFLSLENERGCHRDRIIDCLWPYVSGEQGRRRLNTTVWRARLLLGDRHREAIVSTRAGYIALDRNVLEIDVEPTVNALSDVRRTAAAHGESQALEELRAAVLVDARQFLAGNYDDWVVQARQRLELAVLKGLETLLDMASTPDEAIRWARMLLRRDPLREDAHRRLIRLYADRGSARRRLASVRDVRASTPGRTRCRPTDRDDARRCGSQGGDRTAPGQSGGPKASIVRPSRGPEHVSGRRR